MVTLALSRAACSVSGQKNMNKNIAPSKQHVTKLMAQTCGSHIDEDVSSSSGTKSSLCASASSSMEPEQDTY